MAAIIDSVSIQSPKFQRRQRAAKECKVVVDWHGHGGLINTCGYVGETPRGANAEMGEWGAKRMGKQENVPLC